MLHRQNWQNGTTSISANGLHSSDWVNGRRGAVLKSFCSQLQQKFSYELCYQIELLDTNHVLLTSINSWFSGEDKYRFMLTGGGSPSRCEKKVLVLTEVTLSGGTVDLGSSVGVANTIVYYKSLLKTWVSDQPERVKSARYDTEAQWNIIPYLVRTASKIQSGWLLSANKWQVLFVIQALRGEKYYGRV